MLSAPSSPFCCPSLPSSLPSLLNSPPSIPSLPSLYLPSLPSLLPLSPRFSLATSQSLKAHILQLISDALPRHSHPPDSVSRNLLRFLTTVSGYPEVRVSVAQRMEAWIQNPKVQVCVCVCACVCACVCVCVCV